MHGTPPPDTAQQLQQTPGVSLARSGAAAPLRSPNETPDRRHTSWNPNAQSWGIGQGCVHDPWSQPAPRAYSCPSTMGNVQQPVTQPVQQLTQLPVYYLQQLVQEFGGVPPANLAQQVYAMAVNLAAQAQAQQQQAPSVGVTEPPSTASWQRILFA
jgi:hypothetical protein